MRKATIFIPDDVEAYIEQGKDEKIGRWRTKQDAIVDMCRHFMRSYPHEIFLLEKGKNSKD